MSRAGLRGGYFLSSMNGRLRVACPLFTDERTLRTNVTAMARTPPTLHDFDEVIELLASDPRASVHSPEWIRQTIVLGGEKTRIVRYILEYAPSNGNPPRVLDVGGQIGAFALYAARSGCRVAAVDYELFTRVYAPILTEHGVDYRTCDVASQPLPFADASFDAVTYNDVIEHHSFSPKRVLCEIHRVLAPGGLILVSTPNHASIYNRIGLLLGKSVNDNFEHYFNGAADQSTYLGHHREYTQSELRRALEATGFKVRECRAAEEDLASLVHFLRSRSGWKEMLAQRRALLVRMLGNVWAPLRLPFGRMLWAVGQKPL